MIELYYGPVINPQSLRRYLALPRCLIAIGSDGNIIWVEDDIEADAIANIIAGHGLKDAEYKLVDFTATPGEFLMPGLIDTHVVRRLRSSRAPSTDHPSARVPVPQPGRVRIPSIRASSALTCPQWRRPRTPRLALCDCLPNGVHVRRQHVCRACVQRCHRSLHCIWGTWWCTHCADRRSSTWLI
jgi:hypothetical protein